MRRENRRVVIVTERVEGEEREKTKMLKRYTERERKKQMISSIIIY